MKAVKCSNCGQNHEGEGEFCEYCGSNLKKTILQSDQEQFPHRNLAKVQTKALVLFINLLLLAVICVILFRYYVDKDLKSSVFHIVVGVFGALFLITAIIFFTINTKKQEK